MAFTRNDLYDKIKELYSIDEITSLIDNQIDKYTRQQRFTYLEIARALAYFILEKKGEVRIDAGIGIVPYVMEDAKKYFKKLNELKKQQELDSANFQKQKTTRYDIECKQLPKNKKKTIELIDIGAISFEEEDNE